MYYGLFQCTMVFDNQFQGIIDLKIILHEYSLEKGVNSWKTCKESLKYTKMAYKAYKIFCIKIR